MSTRRGWRSPEAAAGHGPSPDTRGHWPSPWGTRMSCTAWRSDCSPSRICSTCSDSSITLEVGERSRGQQASPISRACSSLPVPVSSTHRLPKLVQCVHAPCFARPQGDSEQATVCEKDEIIRAAKRQFGIQAWPLSTDLAHLLSLALVKLLNFA